MPLSSDPLSWTPALEVLVPPIWIHLLGFTMSCLFLRRQSSTSGYFELYFHCIAVNSQSSGATSALINCTILWSDFIDDLSGRYHYRYQSHQFKAYSLTYSFLMKDHFHLVRLHRSLILVLYLRGSLAWFFFCAQDLLFCHLPRARTCSRIIISLSTRDLLLSLYFFGPALMLVFCLDTADWLRPSLSHQTWQVGFFLVLPYLSAPTSELISCFGHSVRRFGSTSLPGHSLV